MTKLLAEWTDDGLMNREQKNVTDVFLVALPLPEPRRVVWFWVVGMWRGRMGSQKEADGWDCREKLVGLNFLRANISLEK